MTIVAQDAPIADCAPAVSSPIQLCVPEIRGNEWAYIKECLDTNWVSSVGEYVDRFERSLASVTGARFAVATSSGTSALHTALMVAGVEADDEVLVSTLTFIAPVNAIRYVGAWPVFIDAEPDYWQMDTARLAQFLEHGCEHRGSALYDRATNRRVRALLPVHVMGHPVDMAPLLDLARRYELVVIEDATESLGARYRGTPVGHMGDVACFSFNGNKLITTGGGGMLVTDREDWARRAKYLTTQAKDDPIEFEHGAVGYNYRLTNIQAAMGVAQMEQLDDYLAAKRRIAERYAAALADVPGLTVMRQASWAQSAWWLYTVLVDPVEFGMDARALMRYLGARQIQTRPLWQPIHQSKPYRGMMPALGCPISEQLHRQALSLPCSVGLQAEQQTRVIDAIVAARQEVAERVHGKAPGR
ncbi:MAG TPA: LegC family aminotransferase [Gemmatimonadaceae bacterium]|jgi:perosamine synthetase